MYLFFKHNSALEIVLFLDCGCDPVGSSANSCGLGGICTSCNLGYSGDKCDSCESTYFRNGSVCNGETLS